jgi:aminomethyltransferase
MDMKRTALYEKHLALNAHMVEFTGYAMPVYYNSIIEEHKSVRTNGGIFDVSHMGEVFVSGADAQTFLNKMTVNNVSKLVDGQVQYSAMMTPEGGIVDDLLVHRFNQDKFMLVINASNREKDLSWLKQHLQGDVVMQDLSDEFSLLALQGHLAYDMILDLADQDLASIEYYNFIEGSIKGIPLIIARTGYTGERGFELYVDNSRAGELWDLVYAAGQKIGVVPIGLGARDSLRLEMKFALYGNDIDDSTSTIEADLGWITRAKKKGGFLGKEVVVKHKTDGVKRKLIGFELKGRGIPRPGQICVLDGQEIGKVTSGCMSPMLAKGIGMAYLRTDCISEGTSFQIRQARKELDACVVPTPFYHPEVSCK